MALANPKELPIPKWTGLAIAGLALAAAFALTMKFGLGAALILLAGGALVLFIWLSFRAVQSVTEPDDDSILVEAAPTAAQTRKQSAMRALKDIEFERSIGNLTEDDYRELEGRYREEAKLAMREVDHERQQLRERAEAIAKRALDKAFAEEEETEAAKEEPAEAPKPTTLVCPKCKTKNDPDAAFCKRCAEKLGEA